jgi:hypothetical protein
MARCPTPVQIPAFAQRGSRELEHRQPIGAACAITDVIGLGMETIDDPSDLRYFSRPSLAWGGSLAASSDGP